ncbi:MAG TPA: 3D domain-containing protein [Gaiellaceae bacterium]|jgi:hypothetical protein
MSSRLVWVAAAPLVLAAASLRVDVAAARPCPPPVRPPVHERPIVRPRWLPGTIITEYWPAPERWATGRLVRVPGLPGRHRVDWVYGARGLPMEGQGIGLDGRFYHFAGPYGLTWISARGHPTVPCAGGNWSDGRPYWLAGGWRNAAGEVTFPLAGGSWSNGRGRVVQPAQAPQFRPGPSLRLPYWKTVAVDTRLIPRGSRVFVPAYCATPSHGWFVARDTGGAIIGAHIDVYRPAPSQPSKGALLRNQRIFVVPPGWTRTAAGRPLPHCPAK